VLLSLLRQIRIDEEDAEMLDEELEKLEHVAKYIMEVSGALIRIYKGDISETLALHLLPQFYSVLEDSTAQENDRLNALCFIDDLLEFSSNEVFMKIYSQITQLYLSIFQKTESGDPQQSLIYGLGVVAQKTPKATFAPLLQASVNAGFQMVYHGDAFSDERKIATETAIGALVKFAVFQYDNVVINDDAVRKILGFLPLVNEPEEAQNTHRILSEQIITQNPAIFGQANSNLPIIKQVLDKINQIATTQPELEILDEDATAKFKQAVQFISSL